MRWSANLNLLWPDRDPYERVSAAAAAGFRHVELLFPQDMDLARLETALARCGVQMVLFDATAGDWSAGERGLMALPGREAEFDAAIEMALVLAARFGTRLLNVLVGIPPSDACADVVRETAVRNLLTASDRAASAGVTVLVESLNTIDVPGCWAGTVDAAAALVREVARDNVRLQLDQYHVGRMGGDPLLALDENFDILGHVQIADVPGRHEPGTGSQPINEFLDALDARGYAGFVGLEYRPLADTDDGLAWLSRRPAIRRR